MTEAINLKNSTMMFLLYVKSSMKPEGEDFIFAQSASTIQKSLNKPISMIFQFKRDAVTLGILTDVTYLTNKVAHYKVNTEILNELIKNRNE